MRKFVRNVVAGLTVASTLALTATPADAQRYRYHRYYRHHDRTGTAIATGILALGVGAAIASSNRGYYGNGYYGNDYYDPYYGGYYRSGYYRSGYYPRRCVTRVQYDPYYDEYVRVRYC